MKNPPNNPITERAKVTNRHITKESTQMANKPEKIFTVVGSGGLVPKLCPTLATPWTVARQAPLSTGFSRQESWSGLPFPSPGDLSNLGIKPGFPASQADS